MKKLILTCILCFISNIVVSSAFQYEIIKGDKKTYGKDSFFIKVTADSGSLYIYNAEMTAGSYGWVKKNPITGELTSGIGDGTTTTRYQPGIATGITGYKLGDFNEGDEIAIWLTVDNKKLASADNFIQDIKLDKNNRHLYKGKDDLGFDLHRFQYKGSKLYFNIGASGVMSPEPSGKPLPSVMITLIISVAILGSLHLRNGCKRI